MRALIISVLIALKTILLASMILAAGTFGWILGLLGLSGLLFATLVAVFLRWTFVKESSAKAIMRSGALNRIVLSKKHHFLAPSDEFPFDGKKCSQGDLVEDKDYVYKFFGSEKLGSLLGGLRFYIWRLEKVYWYTWTFLKSEPDGKISTRRDEVADYILVQDYGYGLEMKGKDVVDKAKVPVESSFTILARIINPHKALFEVGHWFETFMSLAEPVIRDYINDHTYEEMVDNNSLSADIFAKFSKQQIKDEIIGDPIHGYNASIIDVLRKRYGIELRAIQCRGIRLAGAYQDAQTEQWKAQMDAQRDIAKRTGSTTGAFMAMLLRELVGPEPTLVGIGSTADQNESRRLREEYKRKVKAIRDDFDNNPDTFEKKYAGVIKRCTDWINRQIDADAGALKSYHFEGASGGMDLIALLGEALHGVGSTNGGKKPINGDETRKKKKEKGGEESGKGDADDYDWGDEEK